MIDESKVITMTKLAIMEKNNIQKDLKITSYYEEDYVYVNNFKTRISILLLMGMGIAGQLLWRVEKGMRMPTGINEVISEYIVPYGTLIIVGVVVYTIISTLVYRKRYRQADKRVKQYEQMLKQLNQEEERKIKEAKQYANRGRAFKMETKDTTAL